MLGGLLLPPSCMRCNCSHIHSWLPSELARPALRRGPRASRGAMAEIPKDKQGFPDPLVKKSNFLFVFQL